ncbi:hypothetical protein [Lacticigenium naphthae]|uniref:hypothetical protein n=1 Tax=Lacticigenium naphthae TaxID=515351 RepID=UPI000404A93D|nr:hypothetical protein [Lacticigenium naphthae]
MEENVLFVIVLNRLELLDDLLLAFNDNVGQAATVIDSVGMAQRLSQLSEPQIIATLRPLIISDQAENKTIYSVIPRASLQEARKTVRKVLSDIEKPNTGIMFALPLIFQEGIQL